MNKLTEPCSILVYDAKNENLVTFLTIDVPLEYSFYGIQFEDCLDIGVFCNANGDSIEEILNNDLNLLTEKLTKVREELLADNYYEKTQPLAILYQQYAKEYFLEKERMTGHYKKFSKSDIAKRFDNFFKIHPELQENGKFYLDSRFRLGSYDKKCIINGKERTVISVKENKIFTKEEFIQAIMENEQELIKTYKKNNQMFYDDAKKDYLDLRNKVKELLKTHPRVRLIGYHTYGRVKEINNLSIDDFTFLDYLKVKPKHLYWFEK